MRVKTPRSLNWPRIPEGIPQSTKAFFRKWQVLLDDLTRDVNQDISSGNGPFKISSSTPAVSDLNEGELFNYDSIEALSWLSGWTQRQVISVSNFSANCQFRLDLSGMNWDSVQSDGDDIRVTDNDGTTLFDIWLEEFNYGAHTGTLWIKLPASNSGDLYLYTGKADAPSVSSGSDTFLLFDHFLGDSLDTDKWNSYAESGCSVTVSDSEVNIAIPAVADRECYIYDKNTHAYPITIGIRSKSYSIYPNLIGMSIGGYPPDEGYNCFLLGKLHRFDVWLYGRQRKDDVFSEQSYGTATGHDNYHRYEVKWWANNVQYFRDWSSLGGATANVPTVNLYVLFGIGNYGNAFSGWVKADFVYLRKYVATEPTGTFGNAKVGSLVYTRRLYTRINGVLRYLTWT